MKSTSKGINKGPQGTVNGVSPHTKGTPATRGPKPTGKIPAGKGKGGQK